MVSFLRELAAAFPRFLRRCRDEPRVVGVRIWQCFFEWHVPISSEEELSKAQAILVLAASDRILDMPSETNQKLAKLADEESIKRNIPIHAQGEAARCCRSPHVTRTKRIFELRQEPNYRYPGSNWVVDQQVPWCESRGYKRVMVLAYEHYLWRPVMMYRKLGFVVSVPAGIPKALRQHGAEQLRHRSFITSYPYEIAARLLSVYMGWI